MLIYFFEQVAFIDIPESWALDQDDSPLIEEAIKWSTCFGSVCISTSTMLRLLASRESSASMIEMSSRELPEALESWLWTSLLIAVSTNMGGLA
jgi:hypothetical protein